MTNKKYNENNFEEDLEFVIQNKDKLKQEDRILAEKLFDLENEFKN